jgi:hypothetical protein
MILISNFTNFLVKLAFAAKNGSKNEKKLESELTIFSISWPGLASCKIVSPYCNVQCMYSVHVRIFALILSH